VSERARRKKAAAMPRNFLRKFGDGIRTRIATSASSGDAENPLLKIKREKNKEEDDPRKMGFWRFADHHRIWW
jgi:hypothetical protein